MKLETYEFKDENDWYLPFIISKYIWYSVWSKEMFYGNGIHANKQQLWVPLVMTMCAVEI